MAEAYDRAKALVRLWVDLDSKADEFARDKRADDLAEMDQRIRAIERELKEMGAGQVLWNERPR